jgi:hypothetical protein
LLVAGVALAALAIFIVSLAAIVHPSLIRKHSTALAAAGAPHSVPIPDATTATTAPSSASLPGSTPATSPSPGSSPSGSPSVTAPPVTTPSAPTAADPVKVKSLVLQQADYGPGWLLDGSGGTSGSAGDQAYSSEATTCLGTLINTPDTTATADGPDVVSGTMQASSSGSLFATEHDAATDFATINDPRVPACLKAALLKGLQAEGVPASAITISTERFTMPTGKVNSSGLHVIITVTGPSGTLSVFMDMVNLQYGRAESFVQFISTGARTPASTEQALVLRLAQKDLSAESVAA